MAAPFTGYADRYTFSQSTAFTNRVQVAALTTALAVLSEADNSHPDEVFRKALAHRVIADPTAITPALAMAISSPGFASGDDITDGFVLQFTQDLWSKFAATGA